MSPLFAVTAATGHLGRLVVEDLLGRVPADQVVAVVRDAAKAQPLADRGVAVRVAGYDDPDALAAALEGVDRVLLISGNELGRRVAQHTNVVEAAKTAGVAHLSYTSAPHADATDLILAPEHKGSEEAVRASGIPFALLRNNWYTENYVAAMEDVRGTGVLVSATGGGRVASATRADLAAGAAAVLTGEGHDDVVYELAGDEAWTFDELAAVMADVLGRPVRHEQVTPEERASQLVAAGTPEAAAGFVAALEANIAGGALADASGDLSRILGRPTTTLREALAAAV
jgi:NAD(P)H dehydrogenase (quinone)